MYSKRDYAMMFAREDCRRANEKEPSVSATIVAAAKDDLRLTDFAEVIAKRKPKTGLDGHLRTTEAWLRRASSATIMALGVASKTLLLPCPEDIVDVHDLHRAPINEIVLDDANKSDDMVTVNEEDEKRGEEPRSPELSEPDGGATRFCEDGRSVVSTATSAAARKLPRDGDDGRSVVSTATSAAAHRKSTVSVPLARVIEQGENEDSVKEQYRLDKDNLVQQQKAGMLRPEQFQRKSAALDLTYWTKMDRLRNNAAPTVINA